MRMHNPPHPGEVIQEMLPELNIKIAEMARRLHFSREMLSRVINGRAPISPDLAVRLERAGLSTARFWLAAQMSHDLWQAEHREQPSITPMYTRPTFTAV
ncbi:MULTISPECIES: HigA family addiction module antitoxin [unclassified Pseudomonas]|uniref:HigA family addiction module antitoxin n=1 Tax=unclassified Pseudomonas TaxID=196821 RepID=UPI0014121673|nr:MULTISPECIES: HigA family addiction module antitoxin [unclassified Pseudomonas]NBB10983.1 HigA family addiction module antidote protein [Pseudomonas sp. SLFW]